MAAPLLVTGGTGTLGRLVVARLGDAGADVRVLSRHGRAPGETGDRETGDRGTGNRGTAAEYVTGDLDTGAGVAAALAGTEVVVHCAGSAKGDGRKAENLVRAAREAGTRHLVNISVVGADAIPVVSAADRAMFGYFAAKLAAERVVAGSGVPWTTLRASQFHELILMVARQMARLPVIPLPPGARFQPVDAGEVAARLAELALGAPAGLVPAMAGPQIYPAATLIRSYLQAAGRRRPIVPLPLPGGAARAVKAGANLAPDRAVGVRTWEDFLADRVSAQAAGRAGNASTSKGARGPARP